MMAESKIAYTTSGVVTNEAIQTGALQRIAEATELMAKDHARLVRDRDYWHRRWSDERKDSERIARSNASLRGHISRLKRQIAELEGRSG